jgi:hypothetical protein
MGPLIAGIALIVVAAVALVVGLLSSRDDADNNFGTNPVGSPVAGCPVIKHAVIRIKQLDFAGNHLVECDGLGKFPHPEWLVSRTQITIVKEIANAHGQCPVCYTRGKAVRFTPTFEVTAWPTQTETVEVRAKAAWGSVVMNWTGSVTVSPSSQDVQASQLTSDVPLPNCVDCVDPFETAWEMNPAGQGWGSAGTTSNVLYVVLADPANGRPAFWTLLDVSCRAAALQTTDTGVISAVYVPLILRQRIRRKHDDKLLTYWGTTPNFDQTKAESTPQLLLVDNASGQCGSWANFLLDMYQVHGITRGRKIVLARTKHNVMGTGAIGFLVKSWTFNTPPASSPNNWTHTLYYQCALKQGAPGQGNDYPPPWFRNHYIVWIDNLYYDPSYGSGPFNSQGDWENGSIDGLLDCFARPQMAGFDKSLPPNPTTNLLDFVTIREQ